MTIPQQQVRSLHALRGPQSAAIVQLSGSRSAQPFAQPARRRQIDCRFNRPNAEYSPFDRADQRGFSPSADLSSSEHRGFTLIELMIVVGAIALLAGIAWPSYQNYVMRAHRSAAQQFMLDVANREEQYMLDARSYAAGMTALSTLNMLVPANVSTHYTISVAAVAGPPAGYTITATATGTQSADGNLTLDSTGAKTPSGKW